MFSSVPLSVLAMHHTAVSRSNPVLLLLKEAVAQEVGEVLRGMRHGGSRRFENDRSKNLGNAHLDGPTDRCGTTLASNLARRRWLGRASIFWWGPPPGRMVLPQPFSGSLLLP